MVKREVCEAVKFELTLDEWLKVVKPECFVDTASCMPNVISIKVSKAGRHFCTFVVGAGIF